MARPSNTEERRAQIVQGLKLAMAESGYEGASIQAIARKAGITPGLVHYHFGGKHEILLALMDSLADGLAQRARLAVGAPRRRLTRRIEAWLALDATADPEAVACWVALGAAAVRMEEVRRVYRTFLEGAAGQVEDDIRAVLSDEGRPTRGARRLASALVAALQGYLLLGVVAEGLVPRGSAAKTLGDMALASIDAVPVRSR